MVKKIFALASVSALTGLVSATLAAGCSSKSEEPLKAGPVDAQAAPKPTQDGGSNQGTSDEAGATQTNTGCMQTQTIDATKFPYTAAEKKAGACTAKELDDLSSFFTDKAKAQQDISIADWQKTVSAGCASCVFGDTSQAAWTPILTKGDKLDDVNRGGCIEIVSGKQSCGQAYQRVAECRLAACTDTCDTPDGFTQCLADVEDIFTGPCKTAYTTLERECGNDLSKYEQQCKGNAYTFEGPVKAQCINGGPPPAQ